VIRNNFWFKDEDGGNKTQRERHEEKKRQSKWKGKASMPYPKIGILGKETAMHRYGATTKRYMEKGIRRIEECSNKNGESNKSLQGKKRGAGGKEGKIKKRE